MAKAIGVTTNGTSSFWRGTTPDRYRAMIIAVSSPTRRMLGGPVAALARLWPTLDRERTWHLRRR
jgi:hypothetical protein